MGFWKSISGVICAEITSAVPAEALTAANAMGISLFDVTYTDDLTVIVHLNRSDYAALCGLLERRGERIRITGKHGMYWKAKTLIRRPVFLVGMIFLLLLVLYLPSRIFFVRVDGNSSVPERLIIAKAEACGIRFGASRREVRSERMKNALLEAIPELQWAGVNTSGCVATISVKERSVTEKTQSKHSVGSVVAIRDGIIRQCTVLRGNSLCKVGQAVKEGQVLVSGYTDCGLSIKATCADAEIYGETRRDLQVITPLASEVRSDAHNVKTRYSLLIGKKLIKLFKDSGISDTTCVKMYKENYLTLPGGFQLPIAVVEEQIYDYMPSSASSANTDDYTWMQHFSADYLSSLMVAGEITDADVSVDLLDNCCYFYGEYTCYEMIGRVQSEEIVKGNGKSN